MTTDSASPLVPKLRFADFADEPPWKCLPLRTLAKRITQRNTQDSGLRALTNSAERGVVDQRDYFDKDIATTADNHFIVEEGDYVYNPRISSAAPVGPISKNLIGTGVMSPLYTVFRFNSGPNDFFAQYFRSSHWHGYLRRASNSGARHDRMAITSDDLMQMPIPTPSPREQQKIADCLSSLDDVIAAEGGKLEALKQHKQGLMRQLFPQEEEIGSGLGKDTDWETLDLAEVTFFQEGPGIMAADFCTEGVPLVRLSGLAGETVTLDGCDYLDPAKVQLKWDHFRLVPGDLLISTSASFGLVSTVTEVAAGAVFYTGIVRFRSVDKRLSNRYLKTYLESPSFLMQTAAHTVGGGIKHFGPTHLRQMKIHVPPLGAQQRIAGCLFTIDGCIAGLSRKLKYLNQHKRGLLQQLFPAPEMS